MNNTTASDVEIVNNEPVTDVLDNEPTTTGVDDNESVTDTPTSSNADDELIEELSAQLTANSSEGTTEDDEEQPPETPSIPEEPMPSPQECLKKHIGSHYEAAMSERTEEELQPLYTVHSIENMAIATEKLHREMLPRLQEVQMMQKYQPRQGPRALKEHWRKKYQKVFNTYESANNSFKDQRDELRRTIRTFIYALEDREQQEKRSYAIAHKPFSKGKRGHFWRAVETDNVEALLKTLDDADTVEKAAWGVFRPSRDDDAVTERPLLCVLAGNRRGVADGGAVQCMDALLNAYPKSFTQKDLEQAIAFVEERGLTEQRQACVNLLQSKLVNHS